MSDLFRFPAARKRDAGVDAWLVSRPGPLGEIARRWFEALRACGDDVRELIHDGHPTACVGDAAFAYVAVFKAHVNLGFYRGAELPDPAGLLQGSGKMMRHVKLGPGHEVDEETLAMLLEMAYTDMRRCATRNGT
ncbi:hypothetical protein ABI59_14520 [Acidobacteria bacterium Mor1]|nr:hypothetical protein ABI59_14520 [Acidobacteria bacterium Mor1]